MNKKLTLFFLIFIIFAQTNIRAYPPIINSVCFSNSGKYVATGGSDGKIKIYDTNTFNPLYVISEEYYDNYISSIMFTKNDQYILSGSKLGLNLWDYKNNSIILSLPAKYILALDISDNSALTGNWEGLLQYWNLQNGKMIWSRKSSSPNINSIKIFNNGMNAITGGDDAQVILWNLKSGFPLRTIARTEFLFRTVDVSSDQKWLIAGGSNRSILIKSLLQENESYEISDSNLTINQLKFSNKNDIISAGTDSKIYVYDFKKKDKINELKGHNDIITSIDISKDGKYLISGSWDTTAKIWSLDTYKLIHSFGTPTFVPGPPSAFTDIADAFPIFYILLAVIILVFLFIGLLVHYLLRKIFKTKIQN